MNGSGPLQVNQIPIAADDIKSKLQKARMQVKSLPDMGRSVAQQEREIKMLEERIERQRATLRELKETGDRIKREREHRERNGVVDLMETGED